MDEFEETSKPKSLWIDKVSATFCPTRFHQISIHPDVLKNASCCHFGYEEQVYSDEFLVISEKEKKSRQMMLEGQRPEECNKCWKIEDAGGVSPRRKWAELYSNSPADLQWENERIKIDQPLSWLNLRLGRTCMMTCLYCSPDYSESWSQEIRKNGALFESDDHHNLHQEVGASLQEKDPVYKQLFSRLGGFQKIDLTGGEPLLSPYLKPFFRAVESTEFKKDLILYIVSGLGVPEKAWQEFRQFIRHIENRKEIQIFFAISLEAFGARAEYIRQGLDFEILQRRVCELVEHPQVLLSFTMSHSCLSIGGLRDFLLWIIEIKKYFYNRECLVPFLLSNYVQRPELLDAQLLGFEFAADVDNVLSDLRIRGHKLFQESEQAGLFGLAKLLRHSEPASASKLQTLLKFLEQCDRRFADANWRMVFPEIAKLWQQKKRVEI